MYNVFIKLFFFLFFYSQGVSGQEYVGDPKEKISLDQEVQGLIRKGQFQEALLLNINIVNKAKAKNDNKTVALGYIKISSILCTLGKHLESLQYLDLANNLISEEKNTELKIKILINYGRNYSALKIAKKSINVLSRGIYLFENKKYAKRDLLSRLYINKASAFLNTEYKVDSTLAYIHKAISIKGTTFKYAVLTNYYLKTNINIDSATHYLKKSKVLMQGESISAYHKSIFLQAQANLYKANGNYKEAIKYYKSALKISNRMKKYIEIKLVYKLLSETYELLNEQNQAHEYLLKYTTFNDSVNAVYKKNIDLVIGGFLSNQEDNHKEKEKQFSYFLGFGVLLFVTITTFIIFYFRKKRFGLIEEKERVIKQKNLERDKFKQKLNVAFDEVISLAKNNDVSFLIRFQEVYPDVCEKLLEVNPKLVNTELSLCAMIWLNFSSKDIAVYTNIQPKTVQTKKYRLRKKLNIPEAVNIYLWIKNL